MKSTSPTQKQREKFSVLLMKQLADVNEKISQVQEQIDATEKVIEEKQARRPLALKSLSHELDEYFKEFGLENLRTPPLNLEKSQVDEEESIRVAISDEVELKRVFDNNKMLLLRESRVRLADLKKQNPGKLRHFERRSIQKNIDLEQTKLSEIQKLEYPRARKLAKLQACQSELNRLGISKDLKKIGVFQKRLRSLQLDQEKIRQNLEGEAFEVACAQFFEKEREKRKERVVQRELAVQEEERRLKREVARRQRQRTINEKQQRARAATLKTRAAKNERFLADNSEKILRNQLKAKKLNADVLKQQCSRAEDACIRKVKQIRLTSQGNLVPAGINDSQIISALIKRDWHNIPSLDNLVAKLKDKIIDLKVANNEVVRLQGLLEKVLVAKNEIEELSRLSHLLEPTKGKSKGSPPRISVENWDDAEELAFRYIKWLGFTDAKRTKAGSDEGKDVESSKCVAQVKHMGTGATRPMLQQLFGVASAEKKTPIFFSRSYARTALEWGEQHKIALFKFDLRGTVTPVTEMARKLVS